MSNSKNREYGFKVDPSKAGLRLDVFLSGEMKTLTRARIQKLISDGHILVNESSVKASRRMREGDKISVSVPPPQTHDLIAQEIPLDVLYEDKDIIVVNKRAGMVVHPALGNWEGTLVNALLGHCRDLSGIGGETKPGIVHRLDKGTSGVMVAAKNDEAHIELSRQFKDREVKKVYKALVLGALKNESGVIEASIGRSIRDRKKFSTKTSKGRIAKTEWRVRRYYDKDFTLLDIRLYTGRTHQIRVHFAEMGHPVLGDTVYGGARQLKRILDPKRKKAAAVFARPALHASQLGFTHPVSGQWMEFEAPLPDDFKDLLEEL